MSKGQGHTNEGVTAGRQLTWRGSDPGLNVGVDPACDNCEMGAGFSLLDGSGSFVGLVELPADTPPATTFMWAGELALGSQTMHHRMAPLPPLAVFDSGEGWAATRPTSFLRESKPTVRAWQREPIGRGA